MNNLVNCYECVFKSDEYDVCNKHNVRIYPNLNNPKYASEGYYYPCQQCNGTDFKSKLEENKGIIKKCDDYTKITFAKKLSEETVMSMDKSIEVINLVFNHGDLDRAIEEYNKDGVNGLLSYIYPKFFNFYTEEKKEMKFELGKYYQHTTGSKIHICGLGETYYHGRCFIGEDEHGELTPVGSSEDNAVNYHEINKDDFIGRKPGPVDELMRLLKARRITIIPMDRSLIHEFNSIRRNSNE